MSKDLLFMVLTLLKQGGSWDLMARTFIVKSSFFETLLTSFMKLIFSMVFEALVGIFAGQYTMTELVEKKKNFAQFPHAIYASGVKLQQYNRSSGFMQEENIYFSRKKKLWGLRVEFLCFQIDWR